MQIILVTLGEFVALPLNQFGARGGVGEHRRLDNPLSDGLHQRVIADGLHENRSVLVLRRRGKIELGRQFASLQPQAVRDVLNVLEPGHLRVVDVVGFVVEDYQVGDIAYDLPQVHLRLIGLPRGALAQEIIRRVHIVKRRLSSALIDPVNIRQKHVAGVRNDADLILKMKRDLKIVLPILPLVAVGREHGVLVEDAEAVKVVSQPV